MKKLYTLFILLIILPEIFSCKDNSQEQIHVLHPGIGYDKLKIGVTTLQDIALLYGDNYRCDTFYVKKTLSIGTHDIDSFPKTMYSIGVFYDSLGISFFFHPDEKNIFCISIKSPFKAKTDKGVILNESTFYEIEKIYGKADWGFPDQKLTKDYEGIIFYQENKFGFPTKDEDLEKSLKNKVTEIDITRIHK